jgi:predicted ribosomally synthesized peptide with SipW-like signal peptide
MTKRLLLSLSLVVLTIAGVASATYAYFSNGMVLGSNTFQTGKVEIGGLNVSSLNVTGLAPGKTVTLTNIGVNYTGNINADLFIGARGTIGPGNPGYLADKLYLVMKKTGTSDVVWAGWLNYISTNWLKIASDTSAGWNAYDLEFTLDNSANNDYMNKTNTDTEILFYAVQTGGPVPTTVPYLTIAWPL